MITINNKFNNNRKTILLYILFKVGYCIKAFAKTNLPYSQALFTSAE